MKPLGVVFTPERWARWALTRMEALSVVLAGGTLCDPTAGEGVFLLALAELSYAQGVDPQSWVGRVTLIEREASFLSNFAQQWQHRWGHVFPQQNLLVTDVILRPPQQRFDCLVGNPPWITYPDLDLDSQHMYRKAFHQQQLVGSPRELLLGQSGLDLAALVTSVCFSTLLAPGGRAGFFLPLSLFHNVGTATRWRRWEPQVIVDLTALRPFASVSTRCGWAEFQPNLPARGRATYITAQRDRWVEQWATSVEGGPWTIQTPETAAPAPCLDLRAGQKPRQGVNTGGANQAYHVAGPPEGVDPQFVHPLAGNVPRWVLIPYHRDGRLLSAEELKGAGLAEYWEPWKLRLEARRGLLLGSQLVRGRWWALLGVGAYSFAPWKVIWSAYGKQRLDATVYGPRADGAIWQANQALQAFIPCQSEDEATRIADFLNSGEVARYLEGQRSAGTRSWAQPGRISPLLHLAPEAEVREETTGS